MYPATHRVDTHGDKLSHRDCVNTFEETAAEDVLLLRRHKELRSVGSFLEPQSPLDRALLFSQTTITFLSLVKGL